MAVSAADIAAYVAMVLDQPISHAEKAKIIADTAAAVGVSNEQISAATGYSLANVNAYLALAQEEAPPPAPPPAPQPPPPPPPPVKDYEAERQAAKQEAARIAAEQEQARLAEAARVEAARVAAEEAARQEAARQAAEQETARQEVIRNYIRNLANDASLSNYQKAQKILADASKAGINRQEIASALGQDLATVNTFLDQPDPVVQRQNQIKTAFAEVYNNTALNTQQKAQQINQLAANANVSREEIAAALKLDQSVLNQFLDTDPAGRVNNLLQTATTNIGNNDPRYTTYVRDDEGNEGYVLNAAGQQFLRDQQDAWRSLEALGYEPVWDNIPVTWTLSPEEAAMVKWLSPQEAASVTGTKINNQLRNQAYIQSTDYLSSQLSPLANQLRQKLDAVNASGNLVANQPARYYNEVANRLTQRTGITDLNDVGVRKLEGRWIENGGDPPTAYFIRSGSDQIELYDEEIYNKKTGQVYGQGDFINLGTFGNKQDETSAFLSFEPDGNSKLRADYSYEQEAWKDVVTALAPIALNFVPGVGQVLGAAILPAGTSAAIQTAVGNAVLKAGIDVAAGVPIETALKNGLVSVGINQGLPNLSGNAYIDNAIRSVSVAALTGGDVDAALVNSVISTGGKDVLGNVSLTGDKVVDSAIASAVSSGISAAATGGDVGASVAQGFGSGLSAGINAGNQVTTIPGVPAQTITGAAGNDSIPAAAGIDTVSGITGADTVNAGVAQNDVLDLIQRDIDTSVANNTQGTLNAEQDIQSATPVEPGTSEFTIPGGTTVGEFAEPGTGGFSRTPIVTTPPPATSTSGTTTVSQDPPYVAPNGMHNRTAFIQAGGGTSDADYATYVQAVNAVISQGQSGNLIKPSSVNSTGKQLPSTTGPVTTEAPRVDSVLGSIAAQGVASFGKNTIGGALSALGFTDAGNAAINKANAIAEAATVAEGPEITVGKQYIDQAIRNVTNSNSAREAFINLGNLVSTIYDNPKAFGAVVGSEIVEEILQIGATKAGSFLTRELIASAVENGGGAYNNEYEKQIRLGAPPDVAHESAQLAAGTAAGATAALGLGVAGAGRLLAPRTGSTSLASTFAKETAQESLEAGTVASTVDLVLTGSIDVRNALTEALNDAVYSGTISSSMQAGSNVVSLPISTPLPAGGEAALPSTPSSGGGVVVAVDPNTNQASVIDDGGNITIIPAEGLTPGQSISLPSTPVDTSPVVEQPVVEQPVVTAPSVTQPEVTTPIDTGPVVSTPVDIGPIDTGPVVTTPDISVPPVVAPQAPSMTIPGIVLQNNNDGTVLVLTNDGGAINIPSIDSVTGVPLVVGANVDVKPGVDPGTGTGTSSQPTVTPDTGQTVSPEVTPEVTPETTPEVTPEVTPDVTSDVTTDVTSDVTPTVTPNPNPNPNVNVNVNPDINVNPNVNVDEPIPPVDEIPLVEDLPPPLPPQDKTEEDLLLEQIIEELNPPVEDRLPPISPPIEGVPIPEPTFPEPPLIVPETPPINVDTGNQVRTRTVRTRTENPTVMPGSRVEESAQILPIRPGLSEGGTGGIEGTPEEEQQPVWNVRSLKLRRLLGI